MAAAALSHPTPVAGLGRVLVAAAAGGRALPWPAAAAGCRHRACSTSTSTSSSSTGTAAERDGVAAGSSSASSSSSSSSPDGFRLVYSSFFARPHKRLKIASLLNTFASFAAAPLILSYSDASPVARVAVCVSVVAFAIVTTGGLHWFTKPAVLTLEVDDAAHTARVHTLSFLARRRAHVFPLSAVAPPSGYHPLASFQAEGKTYHVDRAAFAEGVDPKLVERLLPGASGGAADAGAATASQEAAGPTRAG